MTPPHYADDTVTLWHADCLDALRNMPDNSVDSVVTDPPYGLGFMGKDWDHPGRVGRATTTSMGADKVHNPYKQGKVEYGGASYGTKHLTSMRAFQEWCENWATECLRVLKPGGHILAFGGTRTWHRLAVAVEDAGFEIRDSIAWLSGSGFPKSRNVSRDLASIRCMCNERGTNNGGSEGLDAVEQDGAIDVPGVRGGVSQATDEAQGDAPADMLPPVQGEARRGPSGLDSAARGAGMGNRPATTDGCGEPSVEGRGDLREGEGELRRAALREVPTGVPRDGAEGRLHHGAPASHGAEVGSAHVEVGSGESHQPQPAGQPTRESGVVPVERGPQAGRGWPVCARCGKPIIPDGLGTALKPAFEPVVVGRKPLTGTVAANVTAWGTGALNINACRIGDGSGSQGERPPHEASYASRYADSGAVNFAATPGPRGGSASGRWPANVCLDEGQAATLDQQSGNVKGQATQRRLGDSGHTSMFGIGSRAGVGIAGFNDSGGASRFFYCAKAPKSERPMVDGVSHATVKPLTLMRWLVRLVTPPGGTVLEPFAGSGTTVEACILEGFRCVAIERGDEYLPLILARIERAHATVEASAATAGDLLDLDFGT